MLGNFESSFFQGDSVLARRTRFKEYLMRLPVVRNSRGVECIVFRINDKVVCKSFFKVIKRFHITVLI